MLKKSLKFLIVMLFGLISLLGCAKEKKLSSPTNLKIVDTVLSWNSISGAIKYRLDLTKEGVSMKRIVKENNIDLNTLDLEEGTYNIRVQAISKDSKNDSDYSKESVEYVQKSADKVDEFIAEELNNSRYVKWMGRTTYSKLKSLKMVYHTASGFEVKFKGDSVTARIFATNYSVAGRNPFVTIVLDEDYENQQRIEITKEYTDLTLVSGITDDLEHKVTLYKSTESQDSILGIESIKTTGEFIPDIDIKAHKIEFIGDSGSCGFGNLNKPTEQKTSKGSDGMKGFAALTGIALDADFQIFAASGWGVKASIYTNPNTVNVFDAYKNYDFSGTGATIKYDYSSFIPDLIVINLGTNDYSYIYAAVSDNVEYTKRLEAYKEQYIALVNFVHSLYPNAHIIMLHGLMNEGKVIADATNEMYNELKPLIPNLSTIEINGDGKGASNHPSATSHKEISEKLVAHIKDTLGW